MSDVEFETNDQVIRIGDREFRDVNPIISDDLFDKACKGYVCIQCWEPQDTAFPERCRARWCRYEMKADQALAIQRMYAGVAKTPDWAYDQDELDERGKEHYQRKGIWLPPTR